MAGEVFGTPNGRSMAEQDMARMAMSQAQVQHMGMQDAIMPFQAKHLQANDRLTNAKADVAEQTVRTQKMIAELAGQEEFSESDKLNPGWKFATLAARAGDPDLAMKYATKASTIDQHIAAADVAGARQALIQTRTRIANLDVLSRSVRDVTSPEQLQTVLQQHTQATGENTGMLDQQGNLIPQVAENWEKIKGSLQEGALTEKDRLLTDYRKAALNSADRERTSKQETRRFWQNMDNVEEKARRMAAARAGKAGADVFTKPEGVKLGADYFDSQFVGADKSEAKVQGRKLSERAAQLRAANPALTPGEAIQEAFKILDKNGTYEGMTRRPARATPDNALPLPEGGDQSKLKTGMYYSDGKGVRQWLGPGKGWSGPQIKGKIRPAMGGIELPDDDKGDDIEALQDTEDDEDD